MSRQIKFRAWDKDGKKYFYLSEATSWGAFWDTVDPSYPGYVLEQFTGLKDKNEKEIFEGDLVKCEGICETTEVFYNQYTGAWEPFASTHYPVRDWELIGNVHETEGQSK